MFIELMMWKTTIYAVNALIFDRMCICVELKDVKVYLFVKLAWLYLIIKYFIHMSKNLYVEFFLQTDE